MADEMYNDHEGALYCATCNIVFPLESCVNYRADSFCGGSCRQPCNTRDFDEHTCACGSIARYWMPPVEHGRLGFSPMSKATQSPRKKLTDEELCVRAEKEKALLAMMRTCALCDCYIQFETCPCVAWKEAEEKANF